MKNEYEVRGDITAIFLKRKDGTTLETIVDTSDLEKLMMFQMTWHAVWEEHTKSYYCVGNEKAIKRNQKKIKMHRYLFDLPNGMVVDHKNHDTLDNRRDNLRLTSHSTNSFNRKGLESTNKSGTRGVSWSSNHRKWAVTFRLLGKMHYYGRYDDLEVAKSIAEEKFNLLLTPKLP